MVCLNLNKTKLLTIYTIILQNINRDISKNDEAKSHNFYFYILCYWS